MFKSALLTVMVSDLTRSLEFYCDVLGFKRGSRYGDEFAECEAPGVKLGLHPGGKLPLKPHARHFSVGLQVADLTKAKKQLAAKGVTFTEAPEDRGLSLAYFTDPDGNPLYLIEVKWG